MAKPKGASLSSIFDDDAADTLAASPPEPVATLQATASAARAVTQPKAAVKARNAPSAPPVPAQATSSRKDSHPGKKPVLIHIPEDMHRVLRQLSVEEGGEPITQVTERGLRQYLVQRGYTKFAAS